HWSVEAERHDLRLQNTWHREGSNLEDFNDPARNLSIEVGGGLVGRVWQSGVAAAMDDLAGNDYEQASAERRVGLRSAVAFPLITAGATLGALEPLGRRGVPDHAATTALR